MSTTTTTDSTDSSRLGAAAAQQAREIIGAAGHTAWRIDPAAARAEFTIRKLLAPAERSCALAARRGYCPLNEEHAFTGMTIVTLKEIHYGQP